MASDCPVRCDQEATRARRNVNPVDQPLDDFAGHLNGDELRIFTYQGGGYDV